MGAVHVQNYNPAGGFGKTSGPYISGRRSFDRCSSYLPGMWTRCLLRAFAGSMSA